MPAQIANRWWPILLALVHVAFALIYASITPYMTPGIVAGTARDDIGNPDERAHVGYVAHLLRNKSLPVLNPKSDNMAEEYEFHQPPLYYTLAAIWSLIGPIEDVRSPNSGLWMRSLSALFGAATVLGVYALARQLTDRSDVPVTATVVASLLPMNLVTSSAVSNDAPSFALSTWTFVVLTAVRDRLNAYTGLALGAFVGATFLMKSSGLLLIPSVLLGIALGKGRRLSALGSFALAFAAFALPWMAWNLRVDGHPLGLNSFRASFVPDHTIDQILASPVSLRRYVWVLVSGSALSFVGMFGYMDIRYPAGFHVAMIALLGGLMAIGVAQMGRLAGHTRAVLLTFLLFTALGYLGYNLRFVQPQARYLFPALGIFALFISLGAHRLGRFAPSVLGASLLVANLLAFQMLPAEFAARAG